MEQCITKGAAVALWDTFTHVLRMVTLSSGITKIPSLFVGRPSSLCSTSMPLSILAKIVYCMGRMGAWGGMGDVVPHEIHEEAHEGNS